MSVSREYEIGGRSVTEAEYGRYVADHLNEWLADAWDRGAKKASPHGGGYLRSLLIENPYRPIQ